VLDKLPMFTLWHEDATRSFLEATPRPCFGHSTNVPTREMFFFQLTKYPETVTLGPLRGESRISRGVIVPRGSEEKKKSTENELLNIYLRYLRRYFIKKSR
jgi:hypothetical protein